MNYVEKIKNKFAEINAAKNTFTKMVGSKFVSDEVSSQRTTICQSCDKLFKPTNQCRLCGCFIFTKTKLAASHCPINKWTIEIVQEKENQ